MQLVRRIHEFRDFYSEPLRAQLGLTDWPGTAGLLQNLGICGLVLIDRARQRHQDRGTPENAEFADRGRPGPAQDKMSVRDAPRHVLKERGTVSGNAEPFVDVLHTAHVLRAALLHDGQPATEVVRQEFNGSRQKIGEKPCALGSAKDQKLELALRFGSRVRLACRLQNCVADRIAGLDLL